MTWSTESGYSVDEFYITSFDEAGSTTTRVRLPVHTDAEIAALIQGGKIPHYRTKQDFYRDAITHRLQYLAGLTGDARLEQLVRRDQRQADVDRRQRDMESMKAYLVGLEARIKAYQEVGDTAALYELVETHDPSDMVEPYRGQAMRLLELVRQQVASDE